MFILITAAVSLFVGDPDLRSEAVMEDVPSSSSSSSLTLTQSDCWQLQQLLIQCPSVVKNQPELVHNPNKARITVSSTSAKVPNLNVPNSSTML